MIIFGSAIGENKFSIFDVSDDFNTKLNELSKGKELIYLIFDVNELGISNSEKIKEVVAFREIDTFLISTKDAKLKKLIELNGMNFNIILKAKEIEEKNKNNDEVIVKERNRILLPLVDKFF